MADRTLTINHADGGSETYTINRDKFAGVRDMVIDGANVSVDHTAAPKEQSKETTFGGSQSITVNRDIEPLLSKVVGGAAAAYSLRDLNDVLGNSNKVVRVRRSSDNAEKDFTASEMGAALEAWVNAVGVARNRTGSARWTSFTATSTGFNAATSQAGACGFDLVGSSGISVQVSFDVVINSGAFSVQLRNGFESGSLVSNSETINSSGSKSFTLTATSDFVSLQFISASADVEITNFSIDVPWTYDGYVETWYDQSGNENDATQTVVARQPKIVDAGTYLGEIDFDGSTDDLDKPKEITSIDSASTFVVARSDTTSETRAAVALSRNTPTAARFYVPIMTEGSFYLGYGTSTTAISLGSANTSEHLFTGIAGASTAEGFIDGTSGGSVASTSGYSTQTGGIGSVNTTTFWDGGIREVIIYDSDQSDNRTAIEANINNQYSIY